MKKHEDEISTANTEVSLLSSQPSFETISSTEKENKVRCCAVKDRRLRCGNSWKLVLGLISLFCGLMSIVYTPFSVLMNERLRMMPGFPAYDWWKSPPDEVLLRVYLFNITNSEEFLSGVAQKLQLQEVGPIVYREKLIHSNVSFNSNGTMTYVATRKAVYLPDMNNIDLNQTLFVPNLAILGMASYFWDASFFTKISFNLILRNVGSQPIVTTTIYNYLWNFSDPILDVAQTIAPKMVPVKNMGILSRIYDFFEDDVTVYITTTHGHEKYFLIDKYDGSEYLPGHQEKCKDKIVNSTEGVAYPQFLTKTSVLNYWRKTICKVTPLYYEDDNTVMYGVRAYRYILKGTVFDRTKPAYDDCYKGNPVLENGLSDVSKCYYDFPMASSFPHFLHGNSNLHHYVDGLDPNETRHGSFVLVEPITGIPLTSRARSQSNLILRNLEGFGNHIDRFSNIILPMFWAEYNQVGLPWNISALMYFTVVILPHFQKVMTLLLLIVGTILVLLSVKAKISRRKQSHLNQNKSMQFETEHFIKKSKV